MFWLLLEAAQPATPHPKPILSFEDYPPVALRNHWQGTVIADLTISPEGSVTACRIIESSSHEVLDDATCNILIKRAKFSPAHDSSGKRIEDHVRTPPINWKIVN